MHLIAPTNTPSCCLCTKPKPCEEDSCEPDINQQYDCAEEDDPCKCLQPCFVEPRKPEPGPDAYDEFEACLNGSGLVIRVLKNTHQVENICDGTEVYNVNSEDEECNNKNEKVRFLKLNLKAIH